MRHFVANEVQTGAIPVIRSTSLFARAAVGLQTRPRGCNPLWALQSHALVPVDPDTRFLNALRKFDSFRGCQSLRRSGSTHWSTKPVVQVQLLAERPISPPFVLADPGTTLRRSMIVFDSRRRGRGAGGHSPQSRLITWTTQVQRCLRNRGIAEWWDVSHKNDPDGATPSTATEITLT